MLTEAWALETQQIQLFATIINARAVDAAQGGLYPERMMY
jgi:chemotaxis methyl-accepting protein methylase